ncbi:MAG: 16S rRNA (cytidine(1402)-2'-O)-methyltransferase, partial [Phototrophicales bacterium]
MLKSAIYIVSTPIGNLADITLRAIDVLRSVEFIAAEDTRHSKRLLNCYDIVTPLISLHDHNEHSRAVELVGRIKQGQSMALISDAGTPLISDPGYKLVSYARSQGVD